MLNFVFWYIKTCLFDLECQCFVVSELFEKISNNCCFASFLPHNSVIVWLPFQILNHLFSCSTLLWHYLLLFLSKLVKLFGQMELVLGFAQFHQNQPTRGHRERTYQVPVPPNNSHCKLIIYASCLFIMGVWFYQIDCLGLWKTVFVNWFALWGTVTLNILFLKVLRSVCDNCWCLSAKVCLG